MKKLTFVPLLILSLTMISGSVQGQLTTASLVGWYPFEGNANDISGHNYHGIINGNVLPASDRFGHENSALLFDGQTTNVFIDSAFHMLNLGQSEYSICGWFSISDTSKTLQCIINSIPHRGLAINYNHVNVTPFMMSYGIGPAYPEDVGWTYYHEGNITGFEQDQWYFFTLIKSDTTYKFLINCITDNEIVIPESSFYLGEMGFVIGSICLFGGFGEYFIGKLDDFRFYNRALSESEVIALYTTTFVRNEPLMARPNLSVDIYPNPSTGQISIKTPTPPIYSSLLLILSINGQQMFAHQIKEQNTNLNITTLPSGVYLVKVISDDDVQVGKFIKL